VTTLPYTNFSLDVPDKCFYKLPCLSKFAELFGPSIETLEILTFYQCTEPDELNFFQQLTSLKSIKIKSIPALLDSETGKLFQMNSQLSPTALKETWNSQALNSLQILFTIWICWMN